MTAPAGRRILCAHADRDGQGAHWLDPGERCPDRPLSQVDLTRANLAVYRSAERGVGLLAQQAPTAPAHDLECRDVRRAAVLGDALLAGNLTNGRPFRYRVVTRAEFLAGSPTPREGCTACPGGPVEHPAGPDGRCRAAHPDDPRPCAGQLDAVEIHDQADQRAAACILHGAALLATLHRGRVYPLNGPDGSAIAVYRAAQGLAPWAFLRPSDRPTKPLDRLT